MTLEELQKQKELDATGADRDTIARTGAGLAQALLGWGASGDVAHAAYQKGGDFLKATAPAPIKDLKAIDVGGKPYYVKPEIAQYNEAYQKPLASANASFSSKLLKNIDPKSPSFGKVVMGFQKGLGFVDSDQNPIPSSYVEWKAEKTSTAKTPSGGQVLSGIDTYSGKPRTILSTPGIGDVMGEQGKPITKEEAQGRIHSSVKGKDVLAKHDVDIQNIDSSMNDLQNTKDPMVFATALGKLQRLSVNENKLSDDEQRLYMGNNFKDIVTKGKEWFVGKGLGEVPDSIRESAVKLAIAAKKKASEGRIAASKRYGSSTGLGAKGKSAIENTLGPQEPQDQTGDWKSKFRSN